MKSIKQKLLFILILSLALNSFSQNIDSTKVDSAKANSTKNEWERPFNIFAAAGAACIFRDHYNITISPIDYSVQFEKTFPILTRFSLGLVWNPIKGEGHRDFKNKNIDTAYKLRKRVAIALLINIFQLNYSNDFNSSSPIDVGFGLGYRKSNLLILGTIELIPLSTPRQYIIDQYKDKNQQFVLSGSTEPIRTINMNDNSIFVNKIFPAIGLKIAYSFTKE